MPYPGKLVPTSYSIGIRSGTRQECLFSPLLFHIVLEVLATAIRKERKKHPNWEGGSKTVIICIRHDSLHGKSYRLHQKTAWPIEMDIRVGMDCGSGGWDGMKEGKGEKIGTTVIE